jgi:hypothetical protein
MRRGTQVGGQIEIERTDPGGLLGETQPFLGQVQTLGHVPVAVVRATATPI